MRWVHFFVLVLATTYAKEEENNEINSSRKLSANLDANLRKALLKALTELENEENEKKQQSSLGHLPYLDTRDKIVEKASASALSFFASTESTSTEKSSTTTEETTVKPIVVIQRSHGLQHKPITTLEKHHNDPANEAEQILTSASSSFTSSSNKFSFSKTNNQNTNLVSDEVKATTKFVRLPKVQTTTVTTTTSTEESEAKVEDVQFFSAPLVAAFTVHQDERGLPKSVEPIFRNVQKTEQKVKETTFRPVVKQESNNQEAQLKTQLALQEKQRALEAEILRLKQQQQQQNYLIRQQQLLHQQQLQLQKQKILDEQTKNLQQHFVPVVNSNFNVQQTTQRNEFNSDNSKVKGSLVSFQPSLSFTSSQHQSEVLPFNAQQLPIKNAIDFRSPFNSFEDLHRFNYLSQQHPPLESSISSFNLPNIQPQLTLTAPKHHRVFRQEANTGNFFSPSVFSNFNQVTSQQENSNRFFRSSPNSVASSPYSFDRVQPPVVNHHLNNLLYNSGLVRGRQQEDLNIVSKVLALNHYGGDYRFDSSNVMEHKVPAPPIKKV